MFEVVIRGGLVVSGRETVRADVAIAHGRIVALGQDLRGTDEIDAAGCYVLPGGVDQHVHLQLPLAGRTSSDTFVTGTRAAALGGTTTVIDFVTPLPEQSMLDALAARRAEADGSVAVDYGLHMTIPTWHAQTAARLQEVGAAHAAGCATFKLYQAYDGMLLDDAALLRAMQAVAAAGGSVVLHSETGPLIDSLRAQALADGYSAPIWHELTRPSALEATAVARAAQIARLAACPLLVFHVGCAASVDAIQAARAAGCEICGETCPQYLVLTADEHLAGDRGALYVCAPPLRPEADQAEVWRALADGAGALDVISTDHCPWTLSEKHQPDFSQIPGGLPGIEVRLALAHHYGVRAGRISLERWVALCCTNPARHMRLDRKGTLAPGFDADVVIFDPAREKVLSQATDAPTLHEAVDWTPYEGMRVAGWPRTVLLRGKVVVRDEVYIGAPGDGAFIARGGQRA